MKKLLFFIFYTFIICGSLHATTDFGATVNRFTREIQLYNKGISTTTLSSTYVQKAGDTMTGDLTVPGIITSTITVSDSGGLLFKDAGGSDSLFIEDGGNVGIGTNIPSELLDIVGGNISIINPGQESTLVLKDASGNQDILINTGGDSYFNGGNVGISTTTPETALSIDGIVSYSISSSTQVLYSTDTISVTDNYIVIESSGGAIVLSSAVQIATTTSANFAVPITIMGGSDTNTIEIIDGNGFQLNSGTNFILGYGDILYGFIDPNNAYIFHEISRSDN